MSNIKDQLFYPTDNKALSFDNFNLYKTYFTLRDKRYELRDIFRIEYKATLIRVNFLSTFVYKFKLYLRKTPSDSFIDNNLIVIDMKTNKSLSDDNRVKMELIHSIISKETFKQRVTNYIKSLYANGYLEYPPNYKIYNSGDLYIEDKKVSNIVEANDNELLQYGSALKGLRTSATDPYSLIIFNSKGSKWNIAGIDLFKKISIELIYDQDCLEILITNLLTNGSII